MKKNLPSARCFTGQLLVLTAAALPLQAQLTHSFGSGTNSFTMDFVTIGNPGNVADTTGAPNPAGSVASTFEMGKYEVSWGIVNKANAAVANGGGNLGITQTSRTPNKPSTSVSWNEAARFVNWLNTSKGHSPAYKFNVQPGGGDYSANANIELWAPSDPGYNPNNQFRNANAVYFLPSENEWYKAAYFSPGGVYYNYPTGSDSIPTPTAGSTTPGEAVYDGQAGPADIPLAGGLSPYGTMGQGGNAWEWNESAWDGGNDLVEEDRVVRGGDWNIAAGDLASSGRGASLVPSLEDFVFGFRVAAVPRLVIRTDPPPLPAAGQFSVYVTSAPGWNYRLEYTDSLCEVNWVVFPWVAGDGSELKLTDPEASGAQRFYRVRRDP